MISRTDLEIEDIHCLKRLTIAWAVTENVFTTAAHLPRFDKRLRHVGGFLLANLQEKITNTTPNACSITPSAVPRNRQEHRRCHHDLGENMNAVAVCEWCVVKPRGARSRQVRTGVLQWLPTRRSCMGSMYSSSHVVRPSSWSGKPVDGRGQGRVQSGAGIGLLRAHPAVAAAPRCSSRAHAWAGAALVL